jgi:hypothetical protein
VTVTVSDMLASSSGVRTLNSVGSWSAPGVPSGFVVDASPPAAASAAGTSSG